MIDQIFLHNIITAHVIHIHNNICISEGKLLKDEETLKSLGLSSQSVTLYFKDLGPQVGWTTVSDWHIHRVPAIIWGGKQYHTGGGEFLRRFWDIFLEKESKILFAMFCWK